MSLKGNPKNLRDLAARMRDMSKTVAQNVASGVAPLLTDRGQQSYSSGATVYNEPRPQGVNGNTLDLVVTGNTQRLMRFASIGTQVRCSLGTPYAKYLIGKYRILPNGPLPVAWAADIRRKVEEVAGAALKGVA